MKFAFIDAEKASFPISQMCRVLGVSQSGFFAWQERPACRRQQQDMVYLTHNRTAFALSNGTYGSPRMHRDLVDEGHEIGRHRTARLMRENQLIARQKRRFKRTTDSEHAWPVAPNLVAQDFTADGPDVCRNDGAHVSCRAGRQAPICGLFADAEYCIYCSALQHLESRSVTPLITD
ncbi:hypothetical protein D1012_20075 [Pseudotabrizicola alkalilacus]|uniref:HTH-like domain-containing protein n=1 Tax=Pseudotabrizicola alkalilacus TaxID=2305252 RepID=A0A411YWW7_9RHOB|nr:hypothetical protein D1012_20075 [Pseudotabrizicola alkalilacus]